MITAHKSMEQIKEDIENTSKTHSGDYFNREDIQTVKNQLEKMRNSKKKKYTYTAGELNAYMG